MAPHPLFRSFIAAALAYKKSEKAAEVKKTPVEAELV